MSLLQAIAAVQNRKQQAKRKRKRTLSVKSSVSSVSCATEGFGNKSVRAVPFDPAKTIVVGLDSSVTSPSICVWNPSTNQITLHGWSSSTSTRPVLTGQLSQHLSTILKLPLNVVQQPPVMIQLMVHYWENNDGDNKNDAEIRIQRLNVITETICAVIRQEAQGTDMGVWIGIEGYAYQACGRTVTSNAQTSSSVSILCELGGILRSHFLQNKWRFLEISPTACKKQFTGFGNATKVDMLTTFQTIWAKECNVDLNIWTRSSIIPTHPLEDMVDAFALFRCVMALCSMSQ